MDPRYAKRFYASLGLGAAPCDPAERRRLLAVYRARLDRSDRRAEMRSHHRGPVDGITLIGMLLIALVNLAIRLYRWCAKRT